MRAGFENYLEGFASIAGVEDALKTTGDDEAIATALNAMDKALAEAKQIRDENSGFFASLKAQFTGAQLDAMKSNVTSFEHAAATMHQTGDKLFQDPHATHSRVVDFIRSVYAISNIDSLKESANLAKLSNLVKEVSKGTVSDLTKESKSLLSTIWDGIPLPYKIGGGVVIGIGVIWKIKSL